MQAPLSQMTSLGFFFLARLVHLYLLVVYNLLEINTVLGFGDLLS
jgi:hypothetical protein